MVRIAPSIVSASLIHIEETVRILELAKADMIHFDIEDGCFVPMINLGTRIIQDLRPITHLPFDVHLMMLNPEWILPGLAHYGINRVAVHYEACPYPRRTLGLINQYGMKAGLAFNPKTQVPPLQHLLPFLSFVLILTTEPEAELCSYLPSVLEKVRIGKSQEGLSGIEWVIDGGITAENAHEAVHAGADVLVAGRGIFQNGAVLENIQRINAAANGLTERSVEDG
jgi:ribulose-phosphate 3-epimerase